MTINNGLRKHLLSLEKGLRIILNKNVVTKIQIENFLRFFEKTRYDILEQIKIDNNYVEYEYQRIRTVDDEYKVELRDNALKIYVPEVMPSYKNISVRTHKRIMENVVEITRPFKDMFKEKQIFIYVKVFDKVFGWDIDNKDIKPISDALILSEIIQDDSISNMFYGVKGEISDIPHTEIYVCDGKKVADFLEGYLF